MLAPKVILAPVDFSPFSEQAVDVAESLASLYKAEVVVLHVVPVIPDLPSSVPVLQDGKYENELLADAKKKVDAIAAEITKTGVVARGVIGMANEAGMEIVRQAESESADIVVIPTHGMTGWRRIAFGSVAEKVVTQAPCAVLVLRAKGQGDKAVSA